jgi:hypothetical protein
MLIVGSIPFESFQEKIDIVKNLRKEFNNKVSIEIAGNLILYKHHASNRDLVRL